MGNQLAYILLITYLLIVIAFRNITISNYERRWGIIKEMCDNYTEPTCEIIKGLR